MNYRIIEAHEIERALFQGFIRHQEVTLCRRRKGGEWIIEPDPFIDDWNEDDYRELIGHMKDLATQGGFVCGAMQNNNLKGFVTVDAETLGPNNEYLDLCDLFVSEDVRGQGIGRKLFSAAAQWARGKGARKLYLSAHSAVETQAFYEAMGCVDALYISPRHVEKEPYDCQLEYPLFPDRNTDAPS